MFALLVRLWCVGSGFSFFATNLASVLYTCIFMYIHVHTVSKTEKELLMHMQVYNITAQNAEHC